MERALIWSEISRRFSGSPSERETLQAAVESQGLVSFDVLAIFLSFIESNDAETIAFIKKSSLSKFQWIAICNAVAIAQKQGVSECGIENQKGKQVHANGNLTSNRNMNLASTIGMGLHLPASNLDHAPLPPLPMLPNFSHTQFENQLLDSSMISNYAGILCNPVSIGTSSLTGDSAVFAKFRADYLPLHYDKMEGRLSEWSANLSQGFLLTLLAKKIEKCVKGKEIVLPFQVNDVVVALARVVSEAFITPWRKMLTRNCKEFYQLRL